MKEEKSLKRSLPTLKNLLIVFGIAVITVVVVYLVTGRWFIKPMYTAETIIYVPLTIPSKQIEQQGIGFASDREIDGHIQILKSGLLLDSLIHRYQLDGQYRVDLRKIGGRSKIHEILSSRITIEKTRYNSVSISVRDPDPVQAANMANDVVAIGDVIKESLLRKNRADALDYSRTLFEKKEAEVHALEFRIDSMERIEKGNGDDAESLLAKLSALYANEIQELALRKNHLEREQKNFETELPTSYVISKAYPASDPSWPPRRLLAFAAGIAFLFISGAIYIIQRDAK